MLSLASLELTSYWAIPKTHSQKPKSQNLALGGRSLQNEAGAWVAGYRTLVLGVRKFSVRSQFNLVWHMVVEFVFYSLQQLLFTDLDLSPHSPKGGG